MSATSSTANQENRGQWDFLGPARHTLQLDVQKIQGKMKKTKAVKGIIECGAWRPDLRGKSVASWFVIPKVGRCKELEKLTGTTITVSAKHQE